MAKNLKSFLERKSPKLLEGLRKGLSLAAACKIAQLSDQTVYGWMERAAQPRAAKHYKQFAQDFEEARAQGLEALIEKLDDPEIEIKSETQTDADGNVVEKESTKIKKINNAKWLLSRMHPELFSERVIEIQLSKGDDSQEDNRGPNLDAVKDRLREKTE